MRLSGLLRPLIQREWAALIARFNELPEAKLEEFLFSSDRAALAALREPLLDLQRGDCFYCERSLRGAAVEVDHFVPWSRHPNDAIENLVAAHASCNGSKSDHLAASAHIARWVRRDADAAAELAQLARALAWPSEPELSLGVARGIYLRLPEDARLWRGRGEFEMAGRAKLVGLFA